MSRELIIYGAGGAGRELAFNLSLATGLSQQWYVKGFIDDTLLLRGEVINGLPVLGNHSWLEGYAGNVAMCVVGDPLTKRRLVKLVKKTSSHIKFPVIIGPYSIVSEYIEWGEGSIVALVFNHITVNIKIGDFVWINSGTRIGHDVVIGDYTTIFSGIDIGGGAVIGSDCIIGSGVTITPKIKIGDNSTIGAGSVVIRDVSPNSVVVGNPGRVIKTKEPLCG